MSSTEHRSTIEILTHVACRLQVKQRHHVACKPSEMDDAVVDVKTLAPRFACKVCGYLPEERPFVAEDGHFYHEECLRDLFRRAGADAAAVVSPATGRGMGTKAIFAKTIKCLIAKIAAHDDVDRRLLRPDSGARASAERVRLATERARAGAAKDMALLARWHLFGEQEGFDCDSTEGYYWSEKAADAGDADGMAYQGLYLLNGHGVERNRNEAFELLVDAANEGSGVYRLCPSYFPRCDRAHRSVSLPSAPRRRSLRRLQAGQPVLRWLSRVQGRSQEGREVAAARASELF